MDETHIPTDASRGGSPRRRRVRLLVRTLAVLLGVVVLLGAAAGLWLRARLLASLPLLDGERALPGLSAEVRVERDGLGIPTIRAANRLDVARATGFVHAQDRFFQMDLARRQAAGELAELFGEALLPADRRSRVHRFRALARRVMTLAPLEGRALISAYADGVNAGLEALGDVPFEYIAMRTDPQRWLPEDSVLVILSMFMTLQDERGSRESTLGLMHDLLPAPLFAFLAPGGTDWDAPVVGTPMSVPPTPGPEVLDLRTAERARLTPAAPRAPRSRHEGLPASNNWAVAGDRTARGGALLANDMHLGIAVPNTWYRTSFAWPDAAAAANDGVHRVTGVTLPGVPVMIVGSNARVAWGFTNSYGDWNDLVVVEVNPDEPDVYRTPKGPRAFDRTTETILVRGGDDESLEIVSTIWGPIVDEDHRGRPRALRWVAHDDRAVDFNLRRLETARTVDEALEAANRSGTPAQNFICADAGGRIGWTILGAIPRRVGFDGRLPGSWADGARSWDGWLAPEEYPRLVDPPSGRLWTANARVVDGEMLAKIGDGGYALGARARQIRDGLVALERATEEDMLKIQLDDRAVFLERWRDLLLDTLTPEAIAGTPRRAELRRFVEDWQGRAAVGSVGFRMVRAFRIFLAEEIFAALTAPCREADPRFDYGRLPQQEGPLWRLVSERPPHLLDPRFETWGDLLLAAVDITLDYFMKDGAVLSEQTWGHRNATLIQHPLSRAVPFLARWLDMPPQQLPGAGRMPRVQGPGHGASQRMVVSPGRESEGIFHMPCGQSGHPLSPHYRDGHDDWARGKPSPFLPGPTVHTLLLTPAEGPA